MQESPLLQYVPTDLRIQRPPLSDDQNAVPLREAAGKLASVEALDSLSWRGEEECDCLLANCLTCHPISDREFCDRIKQLLDDNAPALELFDQGLRRGQLQIPLGNPAFDDDRFSILAMRSLAHLVKLKSVRARYEHDWNTTVSAIEDLMVFGKTCAAGGVLIQFVIGTMIQSLGLSEMVLLSKADPSKLAIGKLLTALDIVVGMEQYIDSLRAELCIWGLSTIEQMPRDCATAQVDWLIKECYRNEPMMRNPNEPWVDDGRLAERRRQILFLLADHPHPWDTADTVRHLTKSYQDQMTTLQAGVPVTDAQVQKPVSPDWLNRATVFLRRCVSVCWHPTDDTGWWPYALSESVCYEMLGSELESDAEAQTASYEMAALMWMAPPKVAPLTRSDLIRWRKKVRAVHNPIGRLLAKSLCPSINESVVQTLHERAQTARQALEQSLSK